MRFQPRGLSKSYLIHPTLGYLPKQCGCGRMPLACWFHTHKHIHPISIPPAIITHIPELSFSHFDLLTLTCVLCLLATIGAFAPVEPFQSSYNYWWNFPLFGVFAPQELGTYLVLETPFGETNLAPTSE